MGEYKSYTLPWDILDIVVTGKSSIDYPEGFAVRSVLGAGRFMQDYGFDYDNPIERAEAYGIFHEALHFIRRYFLQPDNPDGLKLEIPRKIVELTDVRELFVMSCTDPKRPDAPPTDPVVMIRNWARSILKVMHTLAHLDQDLRTSYFAEIQTQILDRFYKAIHRDDNGQLYLGERHDDPNRVNLVRFETKPKKSRESTLLKLLHKPENVAEDIFDRVGIRIITPTKVDVLRVVRYLCENMIVLPPNIKPSRSRNTMFNLAAFREKHSDCMNRAARGEYTVEQLATALEDWADQCGVHAVVAPVTNADGAIVNPHSSQHYRAIQFTARQLIKINNPVYRELRELKANARVIEKKGGQQLPEPVSRLIDGLDLRYIQQEIRFFYPYEVQITDVKSFEENERGKGAHSQYKRAQQLTAMRRVMGALSDAVR